MNMPAEKKTIYQASLIFESNCKIHLSKIFKSKMPRKISQGKYGISKMWSAFLCQKKLRYEDLILQILIILVKFVALTVICLFISVNYAWFTIRDGSFSFLKKLLFCYGNDDEKTKNETIVYKNVRF